MKLERYEGHPILSPNPKNAWESLVITNPGAWYDVKQGVVNQLCWQRVKTSSTASRWDWR